MTIMEVQIRAYEETDLPAMTDLWNTVVAEGESFPQTEQLSLAAAKEFFAAQSLSAAAICGSEAAGLYILHPNHVGHCAHIANASYAVRGDRVGQGIGQALVSDSLRQAKKLGFGILQFNAVAADNFSAIHIYDKLGFVQLGKIPNGFQKDDGSFKDIFLYYYDLSKLPAE